MKIYKNNFNYQEQQMCANFCLKNWKFVDVFRSSATLFLNANDTSNTFNIIKINFVIIAHLLHVTRFP